VPPNATNTDGKEGFRRTVLLNGLTVVSEYMPGLRSVALGAWVRSASVHEQRERMGVSHLLEHMVFKGTRRRSAREIAVALESLGGSLDAYTSREHTSFQARVLDEHVKHAADVLGDLIFHPALRDVDLALERRVVLEEISLVEDTPDDLVFELHNALFWGEHPYGYSILGTRDTVSSLGVGDLRELHDRGYQPQHIVLAAAGNVDHDFFLDVLGSTGWTAMPRGDAHPPMIPPPALNGPRVEHVERDSSQTHVVFGVPTVPYGDPRRYAVTLTSLLLGGGMSSRLFQRIREELGLAYSVYGFQSYHVDVGTHGIYVGTSPDSANVAVEAILRELDAVSVHGFSTEEVTAGKNQLKGQLMISLEGASSRMYRAAATELYGEPYKPLDRVLAEIEAISHDDVAAICAQFFDPARQTILSLGPTPAAEV
jgi:predicted Zn-dependent peptidase